MKTAMNLIIYSLLSLLIATSCTGQSNSELGGPCEGCEALYEYGDKTLNSADTLPGFEETEPKLEITGTVFQRDGKTPAPGVILYIYHTNREGIYETKGDEEGWGQRHGYIRGWAKTDLMGRYTFYTFRPAAYPNGRAPEHIHVLVKEPDKPVYYIEDYFFEDDPLLTTDFKNDLRQRGGSGIVTLEKQATRLRAHRNITLGLNIPHYE